MTILRTARIFAPPTPEDGLRILITRFAPRVPRDKQPWGQWLSALAPSAGLLAEAKRRGFNEETWSWYVPRFLAEMQGDAAQAALGLVRTALCYGNVTLLCFCPDESRCHRGIVKSLVLEGRG